MLKWKFEQIVLVILFVVILRNFFSNLAVFPAMLSISLCDLTHFKILLKIRVSFGHVLEL